MQEKGRWGRSGLHGPSTTSPTDQQTMWALMSDMVVLHHRGQTRVRCSLFCVSEGNEQEHGEVIEDFVDWCEVDQLHGDASKT